VLALTCDEQEMWANVGFLVLFFFIYFIFAWMTLKYKTFNQR
jgi:hypothetical protein